MQIISVSKEEYNKAVDELNEREKLVPELVREVTLTMSSGDRFPNDITLKKQARNDEKIKFLKAYLASHKIREDGADDDEKKVEFGAKVEIQIDNNPTKIIEFMSPEDIAANPKVGAISSNSPVGNAILGKKEGDVVEVKISDSKEVKVRVVGIS